MPNEPFEDFGLDPDEDEADDVHELAAKLALAAAQHVHEAAVLAGEAARLSAMTRQVARRLKQPD
jgi:hypothetical protein